MKRSTRVAGATSVIVAVVFAWYWAGPFFAVASLRNAAVQGDTAELNERVDFSRLRGEIKTQFSAILIGTIADNLRDNPFAALGIALAAKLTDVMVDTMVTPAGIAALLDSRKNSSTGEVSGFSLMFSRDFVIQREGISSFEFYSANEREKKPTLRFMREDLNWRLVSLHIPKELLTEKIGDRIGRSTQEDKYVPKWEFYERKDAMDDTVSFFLYRGAEEETRTRYSSVRPTLVFRCRKNKFEAFINVKTSVDFDYQSYRTNVRLRFDDDPAKRESWSVSHDREAIFVRDPTALLNSLLEAATLQIEWRQLGGVASVAKFASDDLGTQVSQFANRCGAPG